MILPGVLLQWAENLGAESETVTDLIKEDNEEVKLELMAQIQKVNRKAVSNAQKVIIVTTQPSFQPNSIQSNPRLGLHSNWIKIQPPTTTTTTHPPQTFKQLLGQLEQ